VIPAAVRSLSGGLPPLTAGVVWLAAPALAGSVAALALALLPGAYLALAGAAMLRWPENRRPAQAAALGGVLALLLAAPAGLVLGAAGGLGLALLSAGALAATARLALGREKLPGGAPEPPRSLGLAGCVAVDEAVLGLMHYTVSAPPRSESERLARELAEALELFGAQGWLGAPSRYLRCPPPLERAELHALGSRGAARLARLGYDSDYEPDPREPGRARWLGYAATRRGVAWLARHEDASRPWLICLHGYRMGWAGLDLRLFDPARLVGQLGLNLLCPVLPLHGLRRVGARSGDHYLGGRALDTLHAIAQATWELRRLLGWVRAQGAREVGVYGVSLGGYHAALLAALEPELGCVLAGVPLVDVARVLWRHGPPGALAALERAGATRERVGRLLSTVSPLSEPPRLVRERRALYGALGDRIVTPDHIGDLWEHWERPQVQWLAAGHLTFFRDPARARFEREVLERAGLAAPAAR
jgi:hypothetical protein